jgi:hypothetical protein
LLKQQIRRSGYELSLLFLLWFDSAVEQQIKVDFETAIFVGFGPAALARVKPVTFVDFKSSFPLLLE